MSSNHQSAKKFPGNIQSIVEKGPYGSQQTFSNDQTGLFWKKMQNRRFLSKTERTASGFKVTKDSVFKAVWRVHGKPDDSLSVPKYPSVEGRKKNQLPVLSRSNKTSWVSGILFQQWFKSCLIYEVK